jgi:hypothetical protein
MRRWFLLTATVLAANLTLPCASAGSQDPQLERLDAGVRAAEGVRAIKRLQHAYGHFLEAGLWSDLQDLFTDDATGEFGDSTVKGKAALRAHFMSAAARTTAGLAPGQLNVHIILQPIVTLGPDGRTGKGAWHEVAMLGHYGKDASWSGGIYENDYVEQGGVWKVSRIRFFPQYAGGFDDFGHKAPAKWNVPYHFEARHVGITVPASVWEQPAAKADLGRLTARVQRLEDETQVQNLQHAFGYYLDRKLYDDVAELFTDQGTYEVAQAGVYSGHARIRAALQTLYGAAPMQYGELFDHLELQTIVSVDGSGTRAFARTTQLAMIGRNGEYARWGEGTYENEFVKEGATWKIAAVHFYPRLLTDYDRGWSREAVPAPSPSEALPPDSRPTQRFASFPAAQTVGFHFVHPVTGKALRYPGYAVTRATLVKPVSRDAGAASPATPADLLKRLNAVIAVDAVENLMSSYGYYIDESAWDEMADTYASLGAKEITGAGTYVGPDRIRRILKLRGPSGGRTPNFYTIHQLTQPVIHVSGDGQSAKARLRLFQAGGNADGSSGSWIGGIYENTALFENGEWKFGIQDLHHIFNASYRNGWARAGTARGKPLAGREASPRDGQGGGISQGLGGARGGPSLSSEMPPDRPIRARQYTFPEVSEPAFHYVNPVSGRRPAELLP